MCSISDKFRYKTHLWVLVERFMFDLLVLDSNPLENSLRKERKTGDKRAVNKKYEANTEWITSNLKVQTGAQKNAKIFAVTQNNWQKRR